MSRLENENHAMNYARKETDPRGISETETPIQNASLTLEVEVLEPRIAPADLGGFVIVKHTDSSSPKLFG